MTFRKRSLARSKSVGKNDEPDPKEIEKQSKRILIEKEAEETGAVSRSFLSSIFFFRSGCCNGKL